MSLSYILDELDLSITSYEAVIGGDIAQSYRLVDDRGNKYFLKQLNQSDGLFESEADGLKRLQIANQGFRIPKVLLIGTNPDFLLMEWIEMKGTPTNSEHEWNAGQALAQLHQNQNPDGYFGLERNNHIGRISQPNEYQEDWISFYYESRGKSQLQQGFISGLFDLTDLKAWDAFVKNYQSECIPSKTALLHGDLWAGNLAYSTSTNNAVIYDPAVYYGHPEMDLGMSRLFGGFGPAFYEGYASIKTLDLDWEKRLDYHQFYPILIHALLFGGSYVHRVKQLLRKYS